MSTIKSFPVVDKEGTITWRTPGGMIHREGAAAVEYKNGSVVWYDKGMIHRMDGPAVEYGDGSVLWYVDGHAIWTFHTFQYETECSDDLIIMLKLKYGEMD